MCELEKELNRLIKEHELFSSTLRCIANKDCIEHEETLEIVELARTALMETAFIK